MKIISAMMAFGFVAVLSACVSSSPPSRPPELTFNHLPKVEVNVASIDIQNNYTSPLKPPHVEHLFATPPYMAAEKLLKTVLVPTGGQNVLRVIIDDASVVKEKVKKTEGFKDVFYKETEASLNARIFIRFEVYDPTNAGTILGNAEIEAKRSRGIIEGASLGELDRLYFKLTEDLMADVSAGLSSVIKKSFGN